MAKYDTQEKQIKVLKKKGNIITFKNQFYPNGTNNPAYSQIVVFGFKKDKSGAVKIEGKFFDTPWYKTIDVLLKAIDWKQMEAWHS